MLFRNEKWMNAGNQKELYIFTLSIVFIITKGNCFIHVMRMCVGRIILNLFFCVCVTAFYFRSRENNKLFKSGRVFKVPVVAPDIWLFSVRRSFRKVFWYANFCLKLDTFFVNFKIRQRSSCRHLNKCQDVKIIHDFRCVGIRNFTSGRDLHSSYFSGSSKDIKILLDV